MDPDTQSLFREMKKACKNKFYADSHTLMGDDLAAAITESVSKLESEAMVIRQQGTGTYIDEEDLRTKYAKKPKQLEAILKNANTIHDEIRDCILYEDIQFVVMSREERRSEITKKRIIEQERVKKKAKTAKVKVAAKAKTDDTPKPFTESQKKTLDRMINTTTVMLAKIEESIWLVESDGLADYVNKVVLQKVQAFRFSLREVLAEMDVAKEAGAGDIHGIKTKSNTVQEQGKEFNRRLSVQIHEAKLLKGEVAAA